MERKSFYATLENLLDLEPGTVNESDKLEDLGWDSLAVVGFIALADADYGVVISPKILAQCVTVEDLVRQVETAPEENAA